MSELQKVVKYFAIAFALCLIVGIFSSIYQVGLIIGNIINDDEESIIGKQQTADIDNNVKKLDINIGTSQLVITTGEKLKVENNNKYISINNRNNKLTITERNHNLVNIQNKSIVTIYIPEDLIFDEVKIKNGAGTIDIKELKTDLLDFELGVGKVNISSLTVTTDANIESGAGKVTIDNSFINNLDLDAGVGKFSLNTILEGNSEIDAGVGALNINLLDSKDNYSIHVEKGIGSIVIDENVQKNDRTYGQGKNKLDIDGGIGSINIAFKN